MFYSKKKQIIMNKNALNSYFPVLLNLKDTPCLVIGGGEIAFHKLNSLLKFNADLTILSPELHEKTKDLLKENKLKHIRDYYSSKYLKDYKVVISATNNRSVNQKVHADCERKGILLNVVDDPELCDFILPANIQRGSLTVSIATQGMAPFYTRHFKSKLDDIIQSAEADIVRLAAEYRKEIFSDPYFQDQDKKRTAFLEFTKVDWAKIIGEKGIENAAGVMKDLIGKLKKNK
jgi:precorrin-2 dehydrogenase/sirohydrochlorin ferrochelatase